MNSDGAIIWVVFLSLLLFNNFETNTFDLYDLIVEWFRK